jgi:ketosteroid isomerase-like protein
MNRVISPVIVALMLALNLQAQTAPDAAELTNLLKEFLAGASRNDAATHDRFWAEDLIYTGSSGRRIGKADIMRDMRPAPAPKPGDPTTTYGAEDIRIQQYGDTAVVAFRLVGRTEKGGKTVVANYLNSGTFLKRNGRWQVVNWQATRMPRSAEEVEEAKKEVAAVQAAFHQAMLAADLKALETLADEGFIWTHRDGRQVTRRQLLDELGAGQLKYSKLETSNVTVSVYDDTAVVRGASLRQRSAVPGSTGDANPLTAFYTLTFVNKGGVWKAVAMHTSRL